MPDAFRELREWYAGFESACERFDQETVTEAARRLADSVEALDQLHVRASRARRLRPLHQSWAAIDAALEAYSELRASYLEALRAPTVAEVNAAGERAQDALDTASAAIDRLNDVGDAYERAGEIDLGEDQAAILAAAEAAVSLSDAANMLELDREGALLLSRIAGETLPCPPGFGLRLQLLEFAVAGTFYPARFWAAARTVYQRVSSNVDALRRLFEDAAWRRDFAAISQEVMDAYFEAAAVAATGTQNRRRLIRSALRLAGRHIERASPSLLATLATVEGRKSYASERRRDFNDLLNQAGARGDGELLLGLDAKLRDADAHGKYEIDRDGVRLTGSRGNLDYLRDAELVDVTLAAIESIVALHWGITVALLAVGVDTDELDHAMADEVSAEAQVKFVLLLNGWRDVEVHVEGDELSASGYRDGKSGVSVIPAVISVVPEECAGLTLVARDETGTHVATGPLEPFRSRRNRDDDIAQGISLARAMMKWTIDGEPIQSRAQTQKLYAYRALEALNPQVTARTAIDILQLLVESAHQLGLDDFRAALERALRLRREVASGVAISQERVEAVVSALTRWLAVDLPDLRSSW
jgi:hypothetical protein